jgi:hypothetical protein
MPLACLAEAACGLHNAKFDEAIFQFEPIIQVGNGSIGSISQKDPRLHHLQMQQRTNQYSLIG